MNTDLFSVALQVAAVVLTLGGAHFTGNKHVVGPALTAGSAAVFIALNLWVGLWIAAGLSALAMAMNLRNVWKWSN